HTEFARDVGDKYGLERGVGGSERTHLSEERFKVQKALEMANEHGAIAQELHVLSEDCKQELSEATRSRETVKQELSTMQDRKDTLQGEIERLEEVKSRSDQTMKRVHETFNQQKPILLDLQKLISEAKSELSVVETAVTEKKAEGAEKFVWDGMAERIERARKEAGKYNHIKALEARIS
ncbi:hypothetical protein BGU93_18580, partial [Clostridioides difficile]